MLPAAICAFCFHFFFSSSGGLVKLKLEPTTLPRSHFVSCANLTHSSRCNISSGCCYHWRLGTLTRPDLTPERGRCGRDSHPGESSPSGSVGLARAYPLTKTEAMRPSGRIWSSYDPPYPWGRGAGETRMTHFVSEIFDRTAWVSGLTQLHRLGRDPCISGGRVDLCPALLLSCRLEYRTYTLCQRVQAISW